MATLPHVCSVCSARKVENFCICRFPLPELCSTEKCRDDHQNSLGGPNHYFLPSTARDLVTRKNHRKFLKRAMFMSDTTIKLQEYFSLLDTTSKEIEEYYDRGISILKKLQKDCIEKLNQLKEAANEALQKAASETAQNIVNIEYLPKSDTSIWFWKMLDQEEGDDIPLFEREFREIEMEEVRALFVVKVKSCFESLAKWHIDFPADMSAQPRDQLEKLKIENEKLKKTIKTQQDKLKNYENRWQKIKDEIPQSKIAREQLTDNEQYPLSFSGKRDDDVKPGGEEIKNQASPKFSKRLVDDTVFGKKLVLSIKETKTLLPTIARPASRSDLRKKKPQSAKKTKEDTEDQQIAELTDQRSAILKSVEEEPIIKSKVERTTQQEEAKSTESLSKGKHQFPESDSDRQVEDMRETATSEKYHHAEKKKHCCKNCESRLTSEDMDFQCPNRCLCKKCSTEYVIVRGQTCQYCRSDFSKKIYTRIQESVKQCQTCGIALSLSDFSENKSCNVCRFCEDDFEITVGSSFITEGKMEKTKAARIEYACCQEAEASLFLRTLRCGHKICKIHANTLKNCRVCKSLVH